MSDSDDDNTYRFKPLGGSLHAKPANNAAQTATLKTADDVANKYLKKATPPAPVAAAAAPAETKAAAESDAAKPAPRDSAPKFGMVRPSSAAAPGTTVNSGSNTHSSKALASSELDDSIDSVDPGSKPTPKQQQQHQPGAKTINDDSFFTDSPFQPAKPAATSRSTAVVARAASPERGASVSDADKTRYSYVDPKDARKPLRRSADESSDDETPFTKAIKPMAAGTIFHKAVENQAAAAEEQRRHSGAASASAASTRNNNDDERKGDVRLEQYSSAPGSRMQSPDASMSAAAAASGTNNANLSPDQSRVYADLLNRWERDQEEILQLREEKAAAQFAQQQQQQQQTQAPQQQLQLVAPQASSDPANPLTFFTASTGTGHVQPQLPPALRTNQFELDAVGALQLVHSESEKAALEASEHLLQDSYYTGDVRLDEVLADHKRLRQRLRAAQHAIEALASNSEPGRVDASLGQSLRGGSVTNPLYVPPRSSSGYQPAIQSPNALSLSQYAHLPPARAVLKLLQRLDREEEAYLTDRNIWKKEKASLLHQIQTLYTDVKHLTALSHQAQVSEKYHRAREADQEEAMARLKADREAERVRWAEIEQGLKDHNMRERVRFNQDVAKLERNDSHYKDKYDAILKVLRRYESERNLPGHAQTDAQAMQQQKKMFDVLAKEFETERTSMFATLAKQEAKFKELQEQVQISEKQKDAIIREQRTDLERECARRVSAEQQMLAMQQSITKTMDDKLQTINSMVNAGRQSTKDAQAGSSRSLPVVQHAAAEIANQYARSMDEEPLYVPQKRERSRSAARVRYVDENDESGRSVSPVRRGSSAVAAARPSRRRSSTAAIANLPAQIASAQQLLSLLPPNANVRGDIEFVLPSDDELLEDDQDYPPSSRSGRPRYARPTYSSKHAAAMAQQLYYPPQPAQIRVQSRSRSRSASRPRQQRDRERERDREYDDRDAAGNRIRREVDRRVQFEQQVPAAAAVAPDDFYVPATARRSRSIGRSSSHAGSVSARDRDRVSERVGPSVNGHSGVTIRVLRKQPSSSARVVSAGTRAASTKQLVRQAYNSAYDQFEYDRYGRVTDARYQ